MSCCRGVVIPGGFGGRGIEGKVAAAQFCRERNVPMLGVCLGLQVAVIEFARNVLGWEGEDTRKTSIALWIQQGPEQFRSFCSMKWGHSASGPFSSGYS